MEYNIIVCHSDLQKELLTDKDNKVVELSELEALRLANKLNRQSVFGAKVTKTEFTIYYAKSKIEK